MKHIFLISLLGAFVSVSAMGEPKPTPSKPPMPMSSPVYINNNALSPYPPNITIGISAGYYLTSAQIGSYAQCLPGYYCPGDEYVGATSACSYSFFAPDCYGYYWVPATLEVPYETFFQIPAPYGLEKCPDGTTSDAGAKSVDDCYPAPTPSRVPGRIAKNETNPECDDTTLGTASGSTDFEADWTANTINITWVGNGATVSGGATTCTYDSTFNLPTPPTKTGYNFAGWKVVSQQ